MPMTFQTLLTTLLGALKLLPRGRCVLVPQCSALFLLKHCVMQAPSCVKVPIPSCWPSGFHYTLLTPKSPTPAHSCPQGYVCPHSTPRSVPPK